MRHHAETGAEAVRVLFLNTRSALGADVAVHLTLIQNLDPARCKVTIATNSRSVDAARTLEILRQVPGLQIVSLNLGYEVTGLNGIGRLLGALGNLGALLVGLARLMGLVWTRRIDIIHSTDRPRDALMATLLARLTRRKNVVHVHIKWYPEIGRVTNWALKHGDAVLAVSRFVRRSLIEGGVPEEKVYTALNATDPDEFDPKRYLPGTFRAALGMAPDTPLIGIVARLIVWKGHLELVEALATVREAIPNVRLAVLGRTNPQAAQNAGSYEAQVRRRIAALGLEEAVTWAGWRDDMPSVMADLDVLAMPSWEEPFGLVVTEAMAMQKPVVGFASGALPEIVTDGVEGLLVPPKDTGALADALIQLLRDPARRAEMGRRGRERVLRDFTPRRQADEVEQIYRSVMRTA